MLFQKALMHEAFSTLVAFDVLVFLVHPLCVSSQVEDLREGFAAYVTWDRLGQIMTVASMLGQVISLFKRFVAVVTRVHTRNAF